MDPFKIYCYWVVVWTLSAEEISRLAAGTTLPSSQSPSLIKSSSAVFDFRVVHHPRLVHQGRKLRFIYKKKGMRRRGILGIVLRDVVVATIKIGGAIILPPFRGIERILNFSHRIIHIGANLTQKVIAETKSLIKTGWDRVSSVDFPWSKTMVLFLPKGLVSVVDYALNTTWYLMTLPGKAITATKSWAIFMAVKAISALLKPAIKLLKMDCITLRGGKIVVNKGMVDEIELGDGKICGWANLDAVNNVTIKSDHPILLFSSFLEVKVPYVLQNVKLEFTRVSVTTLGQKMIEDTPTRVHIPTIRVNSEIEFHSGTILRFTAIKLRIDRMNGFKLTFIKKDGKSFLEEAVEAMSDKVGEVVTKTVNEKFRNFENKIASMIKGLR